MAIRRPSFLHPNSPIEKDGRVKHRMKPLRHGYGHGSGATNPSAKQEEREKVLIEKLEKIEMQEERDESVTFERSQRKIETLQNGGKSRLSSFQALGYVEAKVITERWSEREKMIPLKKRRISAYRYKEEDAEEGLRAVPFKKRKSAYTTDWQEARNEVLGGCKSFLSMLQEDESDFEDDVAAKATRNSVDDAGIDSPSGIIEASNVLLSLKRGEEKSVPKSSVADNAIRDVVHKSIGTSEVGERDGDVEKNQIEDKFHNIDMRLVVGVGRQYDLDDYSYEEEGYNFEVEVKKSLGDTTIQTAFNQECQEVPINDEEEEEEEEAPMVKGRRSCRRRGRTDFSFASFPLMDGLAPSSGKPVAKVQNGDADHDDFYSKVKTGRRTPRQRIQEQMGLWIVEKQDMLEQPKPREEEESEKGVMKARKTRSLKELLESTVPVDIW